jgi:hypothetical protein
MVSSTAENSQILTICRGPTTPHVQVLRNSEL